MKPSPLTPGRTIDALIHRKTTIFKTNGKRGAIFAFSDNLRPVPRDIVEKLIARGDIVDAGDAGQTWRLGPKWQEYA